MDWLWIFAKMDEKNDFEVLERWAPTNRITGTLNNFSGRRWGEGELLEYNIRLDKLG